MYEIFAQLLKERDVTPYQVSKATGVAQSSLSDWKNGKSKPKIDKMKKIAEYFNVSVEYLLGEKKSPADAEDKITFDDFTYAMYNHSADLTAEEKKMLLEMAEFMKKKRGL